MASIMCRPSANADGEQIDCASESTIHSSMEDEMMDRSEGKRFVRSDTTGMGNYHCAKIRSYSITFNIKLQLINSVYLNNLSLICQELKMMKL